MTPPGTLSEFLEQAELTFHIYSIGRRVTPCTHSYFKQFEEQLIAWETPVRGTARVALIIRSRDQSVTEAVVWCMAFPLDELGLLIPDARDALLRRLVEQMGTRPKGEALQDPMKDNPLAFKPDPYSLAALHAHVYQKLDLPPSPHLADAERYFTAESKEIDWRTLDYQSVADLCLRMTPEVSSRIATHLPQLPEAPLEALLRMLEHFPARDTSLLRALLQEAEARPSQRIDCLRALLSTNGEEAIEAFNRLIEKPGTAEELAIISAKGWHLLEHEERLNLYLNALANERSFDFANCVRDLAQLPRLRLLVIMALQHASEDSLVKRRLNESMSGLNTEH